MQKANRDANLPKPRSPRLLDAPRQEMYTLWDVATAVMERVKVDGEPAAALGVDVDPELVEEG